PYVPVCFRIVAARTALRKPWMLVGAVAQHLVDDDPQPGAMRAFHQPIEVLEVAEDRVHTPVVAHVIAEILHRRGKERRYPDGVDAEVCDVPELVDDPPQVPDPVAVTVH